MEFGQLMTDILVNVSCKFELHIFKIAQVINKNVRIAFLYVLSIRKKIHVLFFVAQLILFTMIIKLHPPTSNAK